MGDTLFDADISSLSNAETNILYTYKVADPRRFGVAVTDANGNISKLVEKPQEFVSDVAIVGIYYIKDDKELKAALKHLMDNDIRTKGEFQLTDALQMMIEQGCKFQIWAARHNSAVALYVVGPFRRQGDAPPLTTRSLLRNMGEGNTAKVCAPRGHDRCRKLVTVTPLLKATYAQEDKEAALKKFINVEQKLRDYIRTNNILELIIPAYFEPPVRR